MLSHERIGVARVDDSDCICELDELLLADAGGFLGGIDDVEPAVELAVDVLALGYPERFLKTVSPWSDESCISYP